VRNKLAIVNSELRDINSQILWKKVRIVRQSRNYLFFSGVFFIQLSNHYTKYLILNQNEVFYRE